jgi:hypothetical protein
MEDELCKACSMNGEKRTHEGCPWKNKKNLAIERSRRRWVDNIIMALGEIG